MAHGCSALLDAFDSRNRVHVNTTPQNSVDSASAPSADESYMLRAIELADQAAGHTSPNPMVGCVIVRDGAVIAEGYHERAGMPHAEAAALAKLNGDATGATIYVTLEPCCHQGRTPPCTDAIIAAKPARVMAAMEDPNHRVGGEGFRLLREAGIEVEVGVCERKAQQLNEAYVKYITTRMPFVIAKVGMTLDGRIATRTGDSKWVTGEASRARVHELRNRVDAILVGSRTVMIDDPALTTRLQTGDPRDPIRIILDADEYLDDTRRVFHSDSNAPTWVVLPEGRDFGGADDVIHVPVLESGMDLVHLMRQLGEREVTSILIEGGGSTHGSAFEMGIVDKVMFFIAPKIAGGQGAVSAVEGVGIETMGEAVKIEDTSVERIDEDFLITGYVSY